MFKSIFKTGVGILFSRITGFLRDVLMASILGANTFSDIFFIAFKLPNFFRRIFAEGAFITAFLPSLAQSNQKIAFTYSIFLKLFLAILFLTVLVLAFPLITIKILAWGLAPKTAVLAVDYVRICFFYLLFIYVAVFFTAFLNYKKHFATPAFSTALLNISLIGALWFFRQESQEQILYALSWAVLLGGFLQVIANFLALKKLGAHKVFLGGFKKCQTITTKGFNRKFLLTIWGNCMPQIASFLDTFLASFLQVGAISYLYYANRVFQLPLAIFAIATSTVFLPSIVRKIKASQSHDAIFGKAFFILGSLLTSASIAGIVLAQEIVIVLFQRGAFDASNTLQTAQILQGYMLGLLGYGLSKLLFALFYAQNKTALVAKISTVAMVFNIAFSLALMPIFGAFGLALAGSMCAIVQLFLSLWFCKKEVLKIFSFNKIAGFLVIVVVTWVVAYGVKMAAQIFLI